VGETRKLAAILVADIVGYSRLASIDEERTLARVRGLRSDLIDPAIAAHHAESGAHLWGEQFDTSRADLLQTQDAIVTHLAHTIDFQLIEAEGARL
jgi:class 3 adenylate cyclase